MRWPGRTPVSALIHAATTSCPGISRCVLQGSSDSVARANSWISLTVALAGIVAHSVTVLASASVQGVVGGGAASRRRSGRSRAAGRIHDERRAARRYGRHDDDAVSADPAQHLRLDLRPGAGRVSSS